jgi:hypothetical protein
LFLASLLFSCKFLSTENIPVDYMHHFGTIDLLLFGFITLYLCALLGITINILIKE